MYRVLREMLRGKPFSDLGSGKWKSKQKAKEESGRQGKEVRVCAHTLVCGTSNSSDRNSTCQQMWKPTFCSRFPHLLNKTLMLWECWGIGGESLIKSLLPLSLPVHNCDLLDLSTPTHRHVIKNTNGRTVDTSKKKEKRKRKTLSTCHSGVLSFSPPWGTQIPSK